MLLGPRKQAAHHCRLLEPTCCTVVWGVFTGVFSYASCLTRAEQRHKYSLLAEWIRYLSWVTFSCFPDFTLMLLCSSSAADNCFQKAEALRLLVKSGRNDVSLVIFIAMVDNYYLQHVLKSAGFWCLAELLKK